MMQRSEVSSYTRNGLTVRSISMTGAELYGADRLEEFGEAREGRYVDVFARYGFTAAVTRNEWELTDVLAEDGWRILAEDETFTVFVGE